MNYIKCPTDSRIYGWTGHEDLDGCWGIFLGISSSNPSFQREVDKHLDHGWSIVECNEVTVTHFTEHETSILIDSSLGIRGNFHEYTLNGVSVAIDCELGETKMIRIKDLHWGSIEEDFNSVNSLDFSKELQDLLRLSFGAKFIYYNAKFYIIKL